MLQQKGGLDATYGRGLHLQESSMASRKTEFCRLIMKVSSSLEGNFPNLGVTKLGLRAAIVGRRVRRNCKA